jgi:putative FmdB family regulatory protein
MRYDYRCRDCAEVFEVEYSPVNPPIAVQCPTCGSGNTQKVIMCPAICINWRDIRSAADVAGVTPKFIPPARRRPRETADDFGGQ